MISKNIFNCWLSDKNNIDLETQRYMNSQIAFHGNYNYILLDSSYYNRIKNLCPSWVNFAYDNNIYSHVADFLRVYYIYEMGGFYLDSDVVVVHPYNIFDKYLKYDFIGNIEMVTHFYYLENLNIDNIYVANSAKTEFGAFKYGISIDGAMFGAAKGCEFLKKVLDIYYSKQFENYTRDIYKLKTDKFYPNICNIFSKAMESFGFIYSYKPHAIYYFNNGKYKLFTDRFIDGAKLGYQKNFPTLFNLSTEMIHMCKSSWRNDKNINS